MTQAGSRTTDTERPRVLAGLTPEAASVVGFAVALLSLQGQGYWSIAVGRLAEYGFQRGFAEMGLLLVALPPLLLAVAGIGLGRWTVRAGGTSWDQHLGRAAVALGVLGAVIAALSLVTHIVATILEGY